LGSVGTVTDANSRTRTYVTGNKVGELDHKLTIPEMPSHNHNNNTPVVATTEEENTSNATTGIIHNATGPTPGGGGTGNGYGLIYQDGQNTMNASVNSGNEPNLYQASIALTLTDPRHSYKIAFNGGDQYYNNV
jgi:hypothetical protein